MSNALTVPSKEDDSRARPVWVNATPVMAEVCSVNVTNENPVFVSHTKFRIFKNYITSFKLFQISTTFDFGISTSSGQIRPIGRISNCTHCIKMALLLHNISFTLPFPDQKLTHISAAESDPVSSWVDGNRADQLVGYLQWMDEVDFRHLVQQKRAVAIASD